MLPLGQRRPEYPSFHKPRACRNLDPAPNIMAGTGRQRPSSIHYPKSMNIGMKVSLNP
jgi:hypothetical protein